MTAAADQRDQLSAAGPWDLIAGAYNRDLTPMFQHYAREALRLAALPPRARVVDVAAGPGTLALLAAAAGHQVVAIDFSPAMLAELGAGRAALPAAAAAAVQPALADGQRLPVATASSDAAFSMFGLMFFPDRAAGYRELRRVLRPGGRAIVSSWAPFTGAFSAAMESLATVLPDLPFGKSAPPLADPTSASAEMSAAGFHEVHVHLVEHRLQSRSVDAFWVGVQRNSAPLAVLRRRLGDERWAEIAPTVLERLRARLGDGPVSDTGHAYVTVGRA